MSVSSIKHSISELIQEFGREDVEQAILELDSDGDLYLADFFIDDSDDESEDET